MGKHLYAGVSLLILGICAAAVIGFESPAVGEVVMPVVAVGNAGNDADGNGRGSVADAFAMAKHEVTNSQYAEFLDAVAATDTYGLFYTGGAPVMHITQSGSDGSYTYSALSGYENKPLIRGTFWHAARFANWMHNGQPTGAQDASTTEDGAYTLNGVTGDEGGDILRNPGASWWVPSQDEWYKAAYHANDGVTANYSDYPTQSDTPPVAEVPPGGVNSANYANAVGEFTDVGAYIDSPSAYGTFDQGGNVWEQSDTLVGPSYPTFRYNFGGAAPSPASYLKSNFANFGPPNGRFNDQSFRLACIPEPSALVMFVAGAFGALLLRVRWKK